MPTQSPLLSCVRNDFIQNSVLPPATAMHTCTKLKDLFVLIGEAEYQTHLHVWIFDVKAKAWCKNEPSDQNDAPDGRSYHASAALSDSTILVCGGYSYGEGKEDFWVCEMKQNVETFKFGWKCIKPFGKTLTKRFLHSANKIDTFVYIFGGREAYESDLYAFNVHTFELSVVNGVGEPPCGRAYHSMNTYKHLLFLYGGVAQPNAAPNTNDLYTFDSITLNWTKVNIMGGISKAFRLQKSVVKGNFIIYLFGNIAVESQEVNVYDIVHQCWCTPFTIQQLDFRLFPAVEADDEGNVYVQGGTDALGFFKNDLFRISFDESVFTSDSTKIAVAGISSTSVEVASLDKAASPLQTEEKTAEEGKTNNFEANYCRCIIQ